MLSTCSEMALRTSSEVMMMFCGMPVTRSRPLTSICCSGPSDSGGDLDLDLFRGRFTDQHVILALYVRHDGFVHLVAPTRTEREYTMPDREMTATSVVPPPMSTTMLEVGS